MYSYPGSPGCKLRCCHILKALVTFRTFEACPVLHHKQAHVPDQKHIILQGRHITGSFSACGSPKGTSNIKHRSCSSPVTTMCLSSGLSGLVMSVTVRGLAVRGTGRPRGCARSGMPRAAARTTTSASRCSPLDTTPAPSTTYRVTKTTWHTVCKPFLQLSGWVLRGGRGPGE